MNAAIYNAFEGPIKIENVPDPSPPDNGVVIKVEATGICRSDWHGWMGHDADITLPHVPGHELAGTILETGKNIEHWQPGDRVTLPFVCGCGHCEQCHSGNQQICDNQFQPGFTHWGSFAEYVAIDYADNNLVKLPDSMTFETAASLGCRFITSFRAVVHQGRLQAYEWVAVHGCGGVGLSAIMIAKALDSRVIAIDIDEDKLALAKSIGADFMVNATDVDQVAGVVKELSHGGVHLSIDALGSKETCFNSIKNLRKHGRHIQVGIMAADHANPPIPIAEVIANELEILGSHGMQAHRYPDIFKLIEEDKLQPEKLVGKMINLSTGVEELKNMNSFTTNGITVINDFH
jgi:alcohol dehydrogenase